MNLKDEFTEKEIELAEKIYTQLDSQMSPFVEKYGDFFGRETAWDQIPAQNAVGFCLVARWHMAHKGEVVDGLL